MRFSGMTGEGEERSHPENGASANTQHFSYSNGFRTEFAVADAGREFSSLAGLLR